MATSRRPSMPEYTIHAVAFRRGDWWIAQCLEYRLSTQTRTLEELPYELERLLTVQIQASLARGIEPFAGFSPAPKRFWAMYERAPLGSSRSLRPTNRSSERKPASPPETQSSRSGSKEKSSRGSRK